MNQPGQSQEFLVDEQDEASRLDSFLVKHIDGYSRARIQRAVGKGMAKVDDLVAKCSLRLKVGQRVRFELPPPATDQQIPENIALDIVHEDDHIAVINKPANMVVHPAKGHWSGTLTAALSFHFRTLSSLGGATRPGIVHRLDRDTSGVILVAKTDQAHASLASQFEKRTVGKEYLAIVSPSPDRDRDMIDKPIGDHPYQREKKAIRIDHKSSRIAQTFYEVIERYRGFGLVKCQPRTGRTHQIRVHLAHIGCPVLCDRLYSGRSRVSVADFSGKRGSSDAEQLLLERQALHAHRIEIDHPETGERIHFTAPLHPDIEATLHAICEHRA
ncbi:MAG: RluA family pseudouridine synthase [Planctomycetota bacterium]